MRIVSRHQCHALWDTETLLAEIEYGQAR